MIKEILNNLENNNISKVFELVDSYKNSNKVVIPDMSVFNQLRNEYISGNYGYNFYDRLRVFVQNINPVLNNLDEKSVNLAIDVTVECDNVTALISEGELRLAINKLLELSKGKKEYNTVVILAGQFSILEQQIAMNIIDTTNPQVIKIINSLLYINNKICIKR